MQAVLIWKISSSGPHRAMSTIALDTRRRASEAVATLRCSLSHESVLQGVLWAVHTPFFIGLPRPCATPWPESHETPPVVAVGQALLAVSAPESLTFTAVKG